MDLLYPFWNSSMSNSVSDKERVGKFGGSFGFCAMCDSARDNENEVPGELHVRVVPLLNAQGEWGCPFS